MAQNAENVWVQSTTVSDDGLLCLREHGLKKAGSFSKKSMYSVFVHQLCSQN
jgi:hypothetical protein